MKSNAAVNFETFYFMELISRVREESAKKFDKEERDYLAILLDFLQEGDDLQDTLARLASHQSTSDMSIFFADLVEALPQTSPDASLEKLESHKADFLEIFQVFLHDDDELKSHLASLAKGHPAAAAEAPVKETRPVEEAESIDLQDFLQISFREEVARRQSGMPDDLQAAFEDHISALFAEPQNGDELINVVATDQMENFLRLHYQLADVKGSENAAQIMSDFPGLLQQWAESFSELLLNHPQEIRRALGEDIGIVEEAVDAEPSFEAMFEQAAAEIEEESVSAEAKEADEAHLSDIDEIVERVGAAESQRHKVSELSEEDLERRKFLRDYIVGEIKSFHGEISNILQQLRKHPEASELFESLEENLKSLKDLGQIHTYPAVEVSAEVMLYAIHNAQASGKPLAEDFEETIAPVFEYLPQYVEESAESGQDIDMVGLQAMLEAIRQSGASDEDEIAAPAEVEIGNPALMAQAFQPVVSVACDTILQALDAPTRNGQFDRLPGICENLLFWSGKLGITAAERPLSALRNLLAADHGETGHQALRSQLAPILDNWRSAFVLLDESDWAQQADVIEAIADASDDAVSVEDSAAALREVIAARIQALHQLSEDYRDQPQDFINDHLQPLLRVMQSDAEMVGYEQLSTLAVQSLETIERQTSTPDMPGMQKYLNDLHEQLTTENQFEISEMLGYLQPSEEEPGDHGDLLAGEDDIETVFREEAFGYVDQVEDCLKRLRGSVHDTSTWHQLAIITHTLKGSAQMVGRHDVAEIAEPFDHAVEQIDSEKVTADPLLIDILEPLTVEIRSRLQGRETNATPLIRQLQAYMEQASSSVAPVDGDDGHFHEVEEGYIRLKEQDTELLDIFRDEVSSNFDVIEKDLANLSKFSYDKEALQEIERAVHEIRGAAKMLGIREIADVTDDIERLFELVLQKKISDFKPVIDVTRRAMHIIRELTDNQKIREDLYEEVVDQLQQQIAVGESGQPLEPEVAESAPSTKEDSVFIETEAEPAEPLFEEFADSPEEDAAVDNTEISFSSENDDETPMPSPQVVEIFSQEAREQLEDIGYLLMKLEKEPSNEELQHHLMRCMHTLKGSSGMVYARQIELLSHRCEDIIEQKIKTGTPLPSDLFDVLFEVVDEVNHILEPFQNTGREESRDFDDLLERLSAFSDQEPVEMDELEEARAASSEALSRQKAQSTTASSSAGSSRKDTYLRLNIDKMNHLLNVSAELVISNNQFKNQLDRLKNYMPLLNSNLKVFRDTEDYLDTILREMRRIQETVDPLVSDHPGTRESIRKQFESMQLVLNNVKGLRDEVTSVSHTLKENSKTYDENLQKLNKLSNELLDEIMQARLVPINLLFQRFHRPIRDLARKLNKEIKLMLSGENTELDRTLIDELYEPVLHLVRNSLDHGLESPDEREKAGKSREGLLEIRASQDRNQVIIEIRDDGRGIDLEAVREKAISEGLIDPQEAAAMTEQEVFEYLYYPGFSTATETTMVSGRGVGLDAVKAQIEKSKGDIRMSTEKGRGTTFTIRVPISLSVIQSMLVDVSGHVYSIPLLLVEETLNVSADDILQEEEKYFILYREEKIPVMQMSHLLKMKDLREKLSGVSKTFPVVIVQDEGHRVALLVDKIIRREEILIKSLGPGLRRLKYISGGSIMADGQVVLVLDVTQIIGDIQKGMVKSTRNQVADTIDISTTTTVKTAPGRPRRRKKRVEGRKPVALVVDDSLSIRKYLSSLLMQKGFATETARNGYEALELLNKQEFDIMVTDLEMPKLSGYELIETLRYDQRFGSFPIIVLTGRAGENFRQLTQELGADSYIVKPFKDRELFEQVEKFIDYRA